MAQQKIDLRGEVCPYTFVKSKLAIEDLESGDELVILLDHAPAVENVPRSLKSEGHKILSIKEVSQGLWEVSVRKA
jgi:TusA-related sulfurtransferase